MFTLQRFKILYALTGLLWAGYWTVKLLAYHISSHVPISSGTLLCLLLFASIPCFGYILLFKVFPWAGRTLRR